MWQSATGARLKLPRGLLENRQGGVEGAGLYWAMNT